VRVAGNSVDDVVLGSIEYAVEHLHAPLVMVLGHEKCGAVQAALGGKKEDGHIPAVVSPITPVLDEAKRQGGDTLHNAVALNARHVVEQLRSSSALMSEKVQHGDVRVVGGVYQLDTGRVELQR
jgi:carbonic anhydrase